MISGKEEQTNARAMEFLASLAGGKPAQWVIVAATVGQDGRPPVLYAGSELFNTRATAEILGFAQAFVAAHMEQVRMRDPDKYDEVKRLTLEAARKGMDALR